MATCVRGSSKPSTSASIGSYRDGEEFTFNEDDVFVGGILWFYDFKAAGVTRPAAIADIEMNVDRVWLAEVLPGGELGPLVEQPLMRTAYKDIQHLFFGQVVYQHRAFITQLPPGDYVSIWVNNYPGLPDATATVQLHILPTGHSVRLTADGVHLYGGPRAGRTSAARSSSAPDLRLRYLTVEVPAQISAREPAFEGTAVRCSGVRNIGM